MWRWPWAWRTSTRSVTSATHTSAPAFMGQASPSGVGEHLSEGDTRLRPADPSKKLLTLSKTREGMRRLQMGYVWELRNLVESGRSVFVCWYFEEEKNHIHFRYERKDFTVVIQPAFTDVRLKVGSIYFSRFYFSAWTLHATWQEGDKTGSLAKETQLYEFCYLGGLSDDCAFFLVKFSLDI